MIYNYNSRVGPLVGSKFVKEAYYGNKQLLGFNQTVSPDSSSTDSNVKVYNFSEDKFGSGGYIQFNYVCSKLNFKMGKMSWIKTSRNLLNIFFKDLSGKTIFKININMTSQSSRDYASTYVTTLYDENNSILRQTTWNTYADYSYSFDMFEYDFNTKKYIFKIVETGSNSAGKASTYEVSREYTPMMIRIENAHSGDNGYIIWAVATVQK